LRRPRRRKKELYTMTAGIYRNMSNIFKINKLIDLLLGTFEKESHVDILIQNTKKDNYLYILAALHPKKQYNPNG